MQREIEFRGKGIGTKEWHYGMLCYDMVGNLSIQDEDYENGNCYAIMSGTIGQYTGLKDKNGKKIFEGDIVWFNYYDELTGKFEEYTMEIIDFWELTPFCKDDIHDLEVIGTIFDEENKE